MIFYFSATGNSRHVAERIAESIGDRAIPIADCLKNERFNFITQPNEKIGFVCPVYNFSLPITVTDFIEKLNLNMNGGYVFTVLTFGGFSGGATKQIKELLAKNNIICNAHYSVRMPDNWTPVYDVSNKEKIDKTNRKADKSIDKIISRIKRNANGNYDLRRLPFCKNSYKGYENMRRTATLSVNEKCSGCGLCEKLCPVEAIEIQDGKPVWVKEKCAMCLGCLHRCPEFAIQRGEKTAIHGQYIHK